MQLLKQHTSHCLLFDVLNLIYVFDAAGAALFTIYHFMLVCRSEVKKYTISLRKNKFEFHQKMSLYIRRNRMWPK